MSIENENNLGFLQRLGVVRVSIILVLVIIILSINTCTDSIKITEQEAQIHGLVDSLENIIDSLKTSEKDSVNGVCKEVYLSLKKSQENEKELQKEITILTNTIKQIKTENQNVVKLRNELEAKKRELAEIKQKSKQAEEALAELKKYTSTMDSLLEEQKKMKADLVTQKIRAEDELKKANKIICDDISTLKILENSEYIVVEYQKTNESQITKYDTIKFDATNYLEFKRSIIHENEKYNLKSIDFYYKLNLNLRSEYYISNFTLVLPTKEKEEVPVYVPYLADYGRQNAKIPIDPTSKKIEGRYTLKTQFRTNNQKCNNNSNNVEAIYSIVIK